jgi:serine/threonine protein phosphatase PrpC
MEEFRWSGSDQTYLDEPTTVAVGRVIVGRFGGCTSVGSCKNEDGALTWVGPDWVFAAVLDAHGGSQSADLVLSLIEEQKARLMSIFGGGHAYDLRRFHDAVLDILTAGSARERLSQVAGETAGLFVFQRDGFLSWVSIGDNGLYLLHPQLARLGQYTLSVRSFFEWTGQRDSLSLAVPCYSSGVRELRQGDQVIALATDGILEFGQRPYEAPDAFSTALLASTDLEDSLKHMLVEAHNSAARDSATVITWRVNCREPGLEPSA